MSGFMQSIKGNLRTTTLLALGVAVGLAGIASTARAGDDGRYGDRYGRDYRYGDERRYDRHDGGGKTDVRVDIDFHSRPAPRYRERRVRYWVEPQYKVVSERVWIEPVYRNLTERVWVEPVYRTVYEDVYVPARYDVREVVTWSRGRRVVTTERRLIEPGCWKRVPRQECATPGRWDYVTRRQCITQGRWNVVERRVCVNEGRWDWRVERVEASGREEQTRLDLRF